MEKAENNALATGNAGILPADGAVASPNFSNPRAGSPCHANLPARCRRSQSLARYFAPVVFFLAVLCAAQDTGNTGTTTVSGTAPVAVTAIIGNTAVISDTDTVDINPATTGTTTVQPRSEYPREPKDTLEAQIALGRWNISTGSIDGVFGPQTAAALTAFQMTHSLEATGLLDEATRAALLLDSPPFTTRIITVEDIASIQPLASTWLGKSEQTTLAYASVLEMAAEQARASPALLRKLNPDVDWKNWKNMKAGTVINVPDAACTKAILREGEKAARIVIFLEERVLQVFGDDGRLLAHFPVSIARDVEKRPVGTLHVKVIAPNPNYTFDPDIFTESEEGRELGRKLIIPPGPNNPVGLVWIGLDAPGYGIHGTPEPEKVGRTESHGCFRLANWNAVELLDMVQVGTEVEVVP